jgi:hypothetical protein
VDARIARIASSARPPRRRVYASLEQAKRLPELERSITEEKVFAWLLSQSTVTEASIVTSMLYPPYIIERSSRGERTYDIFSRLLMDRIVFLGRADQR